MITKILHWASLITIVIALLLMGYFAYLLWCPFNCVTMLDGHYQTLKTQYHQGEQLSFRMHYNKHTNLPGRVIRSFEDSIVYQLPSTETNNPKGEQDFINSSIKIPEFLPIGTYKLKATVIYKVNPFREISYNMETNNFKVIK